MKFLLDNVSNRRLFEQGQLYNLVYLGRTFPFGSAEMNRIMEIYEQGTNLRSLLNITKNRTETVTPLKKCSTVEWLPINLPAQTFLTECFCRCCPLRRKIPTRYEEH